MFEMVETRGDYFKYGSHAGAVDDDKHFNIGRENIEKIILDYSLLLKQQINRYRSTSFIGSGFMSFLKQIHQSLLYTLIRGIGITLKPIYRVTQNDYTKCFKTVC